MEVGAGPCFYRAVPVADSACDCFATNGSDAAFFAHHAFYDFRNLAAFQGTPALVADAGGTTNAAATSAYFTSTNFTSFWQSQNWNNSASNSSVLRINSLNNIYIEKNTDTNNASATWLSLRTARQSTFQSTAEIVSQSNTYQFLSMRMLARTIGSPGGCMGMFTYRDGASGNSGGSSPGGNDIQEVDLEVLTKYPREHVQCTNQPSLDGDGQLIEAATQNVTLPDGLGWDDWAVYRLDWTPHQSTWYVDGQQIANISFQTPRDPTSIHINAWSDGSKWTGSMSPGTEAHLQIQWWEVLYNMTEGTGASSSQSGGSCSAVCSIDVGGPPGQATLLSTNGTDANGSGGGSGNSNSTNGGPGGPRPMSFRWDAAGWAFAVPAMLMFYALS
ncbi:hypothetical protein SBRCBS47491_003599 [Sporothrix bragantina]|uniref:GH16 domain-containing protein n=1 Tax=Sporothrix bragantina TaxID=671064 RepID=A0ABP0BGJ2_9PEZI